MNIVIIPARGGSKGILNKNIINILGKPLIVWSIEAAINASLVNKIFVTTDDNAIADIAKNAGAEIIMRPFDLAADNSTSESALIHAIDALNDRDIYPKNIIFLQATSPVREPGDIDNAMKIFIKEQLDSLFSCCKVRDRFLWEKSEDSYKSINYDFNDRQRRQDITPKYLENGSIYIFKPEILKLHNNRLGGKIGIYEMPEYKSYQIDKNEDISLCEFYLKTQIGEK